MKWREEGEGGAKRKNAGPCIGESVSREGERERRWPVKERVFGKKKKNKKVKTPTLALAAQMKLSSGKVVERFVFFVFF